MRFAQHIEGKILELIQGQERQESPHSNLQSQAPVQGPSEGPVAQNCSKEPAQVTLLGAGGDLWGKHLIASHGTRKHDPAKRLNKQADPCGLKEAGVQSTQNGLRYIERLRGEGWQHGDECSCRDDSDGEGETPGSGEDPPQGEGEAAGGQARYTRRDAGPLTQQNPAKYNIYIKCSCIYTYIYM